MDLGPHVLAELPLRAGQRAFVDVALGVRADPGAFEVCCRCEDGSYAPVLLLNPVQADQLRTVGHCAPAMLWGSLHPKNKPAALLTFTAPVDGHYAITQERGIGVSEPTIIARISAQNGFAEKLRRLLGKSRRALSRFSAPRADR